MLEVGIVSEQVKKAAEIINKAAREAAAQAAESVARIKPLPELWHRPALFDVTPWEKQAPPPKQSLPNSILERLGLVAEPPEPIKRRF